MKTISSLGVRSPCFHLFHPLLQVKQEDMPPRIQYATLYLLFIGGAYLFSYTRVALCLLVLQYFTETIFHARLDFPTYYYTSDSIARVEIPPF